MKNNKKIANIFFILMCVILTCLLFCVVYPFLKTYVKEKFKNKSLDENDVDVVVEAADLTISTFDQFKTFVSNVRSGTTYEGKTVALGANISGGEIEPIGYWYETVADIGGGGSASSVKKSFNGVFDGCGYTLSNLQVKGAGYSYIKEDTNGAVEVKVSTSLFAALGDSAKIQNLGISNITFSGGGPIADRHSSKKYFTQYTSAIYSYSSDKAKFNCIKVDGVNGFSLGFGRGAAVVSDCELMNSKGAGYGVACQTSIFRPQSGYTCASPFGTGSSYCHSISNTTTGLSAGAAGGASGTTWYYAPEYSAWPMLRCVLTKEKGWKTVSFTKGGGISSILPTSIQIPNDANKTFSSSSAKITIYDQSVTATVSLCHATISWTASSATAYTCTASLLRCNVNFYLNDKTKLYANGMEISASFKIMQAIVSCGTKINCTYEKYSNGKYKSVSFTFKDTSNNTYTVRYVVASQWYIDKYNRAYTDNKPLHQATIHSETYINVHDNIDVSIDAKLKTYSVEIG